MPPTLSHPLLEVDGLGADERRAIVEAARRLAARAPGESQPLRGRHVAIVGGDPGRPSALRFERAARALGAWVSHIGAETLLEDHGRAHHAARMLGSLYDAIDVVSFTPGQARALQEIAGVPVFADLGGEADPLRNLLPALAEGHPEDETLTRLVQAVLIKTMS